MTKKTEPAPLKLPRVHDVEVDRAEDGFVSISQFDDGLDQELSIWIHESQWPLIRGYIDLLFKKAGE